MGSAEQARGAVRRAVRAALAGLPPAVRAAPPLVACSGGADSLALVRAVLELAAPRRRAGNRSPDPHADAPTGPRRDPASAAAAGPSVELVATPDTGPPADPAPDPPAGLPADPTSGPSAGSRTSPAAGPAADPSTDPPTVHVAVVDHGLQPGSAAVAEAAAALVRGWGAVATVHRVDARGPGGPEAAARRARYAALHAARPHPDSPVLLGHTLDDQAETVLLGLGRGSGPRSVAGMRVWDAPWLRPLLGTGRATTRAACADLPVWDDPHNTDPRFTRVRLRLEVLPLLEDVLSGGVAAALARTAAQLREDSDALDALAADLLTAARDGAALRTAALADVPAALRRRVLRTWLGTRSVTGLTDGHLRAADVLAARGPDRRGPALPGGLELVRRRGRLDLEPVGWARTTQEDIPRVRR